jgi:hypothetical protein
VCPLRLLLRRDTVHPDFPVAELWYVEPTQQNMPAMVDDAAEIIRRDGLSWLDNLHDPRRLLDVLLHRPHTTFLGNTAYNIGFTALHLGEHDLAAAQLGTHLHQIEQVIASFRPSLAATSPLLRQKAFVETALRQLNSLQTTSNPT